MEAEAHTPALTEAVAYSREHLAPWMDWANATGRELHDYLRQSEREWKEGRAYRYVAMHGSMVIGACSLEVDTDLGEISYWTRAGHTGQGLGTNMLAMLTKVGFQRLGLYRLELHIGLGNKPSMKLAMNCGYKPEGVCRRRERSVYGRYDSMRLSLLCDERRRYH